MARFEVLLMDETTEPTVLSLHTLESLCNELVSGRPVLLGNDEEEFRLDSLETRSVFEWYRSNRQKWSRNVQKTDVETLADQLEKIPPEFPASSGLGVGEQKRTLHLKSLRVHRFGGIHRYGSVDHAPEDFNFNFDMPLTLIEGMNGAGKSSLLSAVSWCLTGRIYRSQRPPETVADPVSVDLANGSSAEGGNETSNTMTAITPLPPAEVLTSLSGRALPLDTWVELMFADDAGNEVGPIRRSLERSPRGKVTVVEPDLSSLGVSPIALEIGTSMPGLIPYIRLDEPSDLGQAVAALTGIKPLQDLARHAKKCHDKLQKDLVNDRKAEIATLDVDYETARQGLIDLLEEHPQIKPRGSVPPPSPDAGIEGVLTECIEDFERQQAKAFEQSKVILGDSFDPNDGATRQDLMDSVGPAIGLIDAEIMKRLPSASRLHGLANLSAQETAQAEALIETLIAQADELARLSEEPDVAARLRLYALVAGWLKCLPDVPHSIEECPVCQSALAEKLDPVTDKLVADHLTEYLAADTDHLERTLEQWEQAALKSLAAELPAPLADELNTDLPDRPGDLVSAALGEELFTPSHFQKTLAPLQLTTQTMCNRVFETLPPFDDPQLPVLPSCFGDDGGLVAVAVRRVTRAIAFARWRSQHASPCAAAFRKIIGQAIPGAEPRRPPQGQIDDWSLADRLASLNDMVSQASPLKKALSKLETAKKKLKDRRKKEVRIALYGRTATAINPLLQLDTLVDRQVSSLVRELSSATKQWKERLYTPAFPSAPLVGDADVKTDGSLNLQAVAAGSTAPAWHISNASDLRATLLAFLIAFWRHLLDTRSGFSMLLFDDLQELFDEPNRRRVANAMPALVEQGSRPVVTTNDHSFGDRVSAACSAASPSVQVDRRHLYPPNGVRQRIELGVFRETIEHKRQEFEKPENENNDEPARGYLNGLRIYIENRLLDFFDVCPAGLPDGPTLADLISAVRSLRNSGQEPFSDRAFGDLVSDNALAPNSEFVQLMNHSHHGRAHEITYGMVEAQAEACRRIRRLIENAHQSYERWLRRDPPRYVDVSPTPPASLTLPNYEVPIIENVAAFTAERGPGEIVESDERFSTGSLANHAIYVIKTRNLGFAGPAGCRVLVRLSGDPPPDNSLVIALHRTRSYAGRLHRDKDSPQMIVIGSEAENPKERPPSLFLPAAETRLLEVTGILFDFTPYYSQSSDDAVLVDRCDMLERIELVFKLDSVSASAMPLALEDQSLLGGRSLSPQQFDTVEGSVVAIATSRGCAVKRVGKCLPGVPHVRQFESVGGLGESMVVRMEELDDDAFGSLPLLDSAREVLGVLYEPSL